MKCLICHHTRDVADRRGRYIPNAFCDFAGAKVVIIFDTGK